MPNDAYLHLLINHVPVILAPIGALVAIIAWLTHRRAVWLYALATLTLAGLSAYPVDETGDGAAHVVRTLPGVTREAIRAHAEAGDITMWVLLICGVFSAYAWWVLGRQRERNRSSSSLMPSDAILPAWLRALIVVLAIGAAGMVTYTSEKAGYIVHREIHGDTQTPR